MQQLKIGNRYVGEEHPVFFIAELSANHNQDFDLAVRTIKAMKDAGADAVKVQTFNADTLTIDCDKEVFQIKNGTLWDGVTLYDLYNNSYMPWEWHEPLQKIAEEIGLEFFSTPTDVVSVDFLEKLNVPVYKIASFEITDISLIEYIARKGKPIILSTGIAGEEEINDALEACQRGGNNSVILLKCTSAYPTPWVDVNLNAMLEIKKRFGQITGLSDHTMGDIVPLGAVALGAKVVEKHFILDRSLGGPDSSFSMEPLEFKEMVNRVRILEETLGDGQILIPESVEKNRQFARSLFVVQNMKKGDVFTKINIRSIRPGFGIKPKFFSHIIGKKASMDIERGTPLGEFLIE